MLFIQYSVIGLTAFLVLVYVVYKFMIRRKKGMVKREANTARKTEDIENLYKSIVTQKVSSKVSKFIKFRDICKIHFGRRRLCAQKNVQLPLQFAERIHERSLMDQNDRNHRILCKTGCNLELG